MARAIFAGVTVIPFNATAPARFEAKVDRSSPDGCHLWTARCDDDGYGRFRPGGADTHDVGAHRAAWALDHGGEIPDGADVLHACDTPPCVRRDHLFTGTNAENMADRDAKGRQATGARHGRRTHPEQTARGDRQGLRLHPERRARGARNGAAKLADETVRAIRQEYAAGGVRQVDLAARYGVTQTVVSGIVRRRTWGHVED